MKKKDKKEKKTEIKNGGISAIDRRFEITAKIEELKNLAQNSYLRGDYPQAIKCAEEVIKLAVQADLQSYVKEQEKFINIIADKLQKQYLLSEIKNFAINLQENYDKSIESGNVEKVHEMVENFKKQYEDFPDFESIPVVQEIIVRDNKEWIKFTSAKREELSEEEKEEEDLIDDLQRFLKSR